MSDGKKLVVSILAAGSLESLRQVDPEWFEDDELQVFEFVRTHARRYAELPAIETVESELGMRLPVAHETTAYYIKRVTDRRLFNAFRDRFGLLRDNLKDMDLEAAKMTISDMRNVARVWSPDEDLRTLQEAGSGVLSNYREAHMRPGLSGVTTGWETLDFTTGGYQNGDLVAWVARMGLGKTYLMLCQALAAWRAGYVVLIVTMEMTIEQIARRALSMEAGINPDYIRKGTMSTQALRRLSRVIDTMQRADRLSIYAGGFSKRIDDVDLLIAEMRPDIVFIDGAYLLTPSQAGRMNRIEKVGYVYDELKKMTIQHNRPIITTSQFARGAGKKGKDGSLETVAFSDAISMHASLVISVKEGLPPYQKTRRMIDVMKGREGESAEFAVNYKFAPIDFSELPREQEQVEATNIDWMG